MKDSYVRRVKRGVKLLDRKVPNWRSKIDLKEFDITHCAKCVLGQILGDFNNYIKIGLTNSDDPSKFGFDMNIMANGHLVHQDRLNKYYDDGYNKLGKLWVKEIKKKI
jgi:hypothetical protein